jgi:L-asparaginase
MKLKIITTGGTIDKVYFDKKSAFEVGDPQIGEVLSRSDVGFQYTVQTLFKKDSLDLTDEDRLRLRDAIAADEHRHFIVTHGTDTMVETGKVLYGIPDKVVVLTGSVQPARFHDSNAIFDVGCAVAAVQLCPPGVYIVMNGRIFDATKARKNTELNRFEDA